MLVQTSSNRRRFLRQLGLGAAFSTVPGLYAQALTQTPAQTLGPYYPDKMPLDLNNDLIYINDNLSPAAGEITWVSGRVLTSAGSPVRNALVEIWQADNGGAYIHSQSPRTNRDPNFQGYGKFVTGTTGEYLFRTVKPGLYPGRTRHIHYSIKVPNSQSLVTQLYVDGDPLNATDGVLNGIRDAAQRQSVVVPFAKIPDSPTGELAAKFDIILGFTPADPVATKPVILAQNGVTNGAGYQPGITPGSWVSIFGDNLASTTRIWNAATEIVNGKLPVSIDGVSVTFNGVPAYVYAISPNQINVQAPALDTIGPVQVIVRNSLGASDPVTANVEPIIPGFFLYPRNYVAAVRSDGVYIGPSGLFTGAASVPAKPGDTLMLYGTGFGATSPSVSAGLEFSGAAPIANSVRMQIGGAQTEVLFAGLTAAGLYQLNIRVPDLANGDHDVVATVNGVRSQALARLRIQRP